MIRSFVEMLLGDFGRQLLYFYEANSCVINSVVFTYGLFMLLSWNNLVRVYRFLVIEVAKNVHLDEELNRKSTAKKVRESVEIPWEKAIQVSPFPFIARIGAIFPKRMSVESLQNYFEEKELVESAIKLLKGENIRRITPSSQRIMRRERDRKTEQARNELKKPE